MDVIVIGCGASGIAAMTKLHDAGLKVLGLEAADRIGGRIHSLDFEDKKVDVGAIWCHGQEGNLVFELANPHNLLEVQEPRTNWYLHSNGNLVPKKTGDAILEAFDEELEKSEKNNTRSISEYLQNSTATNQILKNDSQLTASFLEFYGSMKNLGGQDNPKNGKSLKGLEEHLICGGEFWLNWKGRGYVTILDVLLNKYPDPSKAIPVEILLNKEVESINWGSQRADDALVQVSCSDGSTYAAKSVIITMSVGVLKERHQKLFNPPLPQEKINAINNLEMCILDKIYIEFEKPWWTTPPKFCILWSDEDKAKLSDEDKWISEVYCLESGYCHPNLLLAWMYGKGAEKMEKVSLEGVKAGLNKLMDIIFKKHFEVTPIKSIVRTQWASNPLARGAYSYRSVVTEQNGGSAAALGKPLLLARPNRPARPLVCFAGEATSVKYHNAVHGAIDAGFREAARLISSFKDDQ